MWVTTHTDVVSVSLTLTISMFSYISLPSSEKFADLLRSSNILVDEIHIYTFNNVNREIKPKGMIILIICVL